MDEKFKILILFYSLTGCTATLAQHVKEGACEIDGADVRVMRVPELLSVKTFDEHPHLREAQDKMVDIPFATLEDLTGSDGVAFGTPVHFGSFASQLKHFLDQLTPVFVRGVMVGKPAACFASAGSMHGGEEAALLSLMVPLLNLGMIPVGVPYPIQGEGADFDAGSPYGAIYVSGHHGDKKLTEGDIKIARILGKRLAAMTKIIKYGCKYLPECHFFLSEKN